MKHLKIIAVGKMKDFYLIGANEYLKRLSPHFKIELVEINDEKCPDNPSKSQINQIIEKESNKIFDKIKDDYFLIALDLKGKSIDSINFADFIKNHVDNNNKKLVFIIGGSYGLSIKLLNRVDISIKLSDLTFPHQMARLILLEQLFRACKINSNSTYHK